MLNRYSIDEINSRLRREPQAYISDCEVSYRSRIEQAALSVRDNMRNSPVVLLSGPSGSGKTTTAFKLQTALGQIGINCHTISLDDYFLTVDRKTIPRTPDGDIDFESPKCVDMPLLNEHFTALKNGEEILIPHFLFSRQKRSASIFRKLRLNENEVAIFEGIHALNDEITAPHPEACKIYISAASEFYDSDNMLRFSGTWLRLLRRVVRDNNFRGANAEFTLSLWANVLRGEMLYIDPFKHKANIILDSTLAYEIPVLKEYAAPLFLELPSDNPRHHELSLILPALQFFDPLPPTLVPPDSLLREFIGGSEFFN